MKHGNKKIERKKVRIKKQNKCENKKTNTHEFPRVNNIKIRRNSTK